MRLIHFCIRNIAGQLSHSNNFIIIYLSRQSFDHNLNNFCNLVLILRKIQKELLSGTEDHAVPHQSVQRSLSERLCLPLALQSKHCGNIYSVCSYIFNFSFRRSLSERFCLPLALQNKHCGNIHSVCSFIFNFRFEL